MSQQPIIDVPGADAQANTMALQRVEPAGAVGRALTLEELHAGLEFVRKVMRQEMKEGQDYGVIPGTGTKPTLLQPGAQKLLMTFNLTEVVKKEVLREYPGHHREYEFTVCVRAPNGKEWDGVGTCSTLEAKYRYRKAERRCPTCGKATIIQGKAEYGGGWICFAKKGGCGAKFEQSNPAITSQPSGRTENPDVPETWNTVRKMGFKRALVAAAINATNTSELWTADLEERVEENAEESKAPAAPAKPAAAKPATQAPPAARTAPPAQPAAPPKPVVPPFPSAKTRDWAIKEVEAAGKLEYLPEWCEAVGQLLPTENLQDWPLRFVPASRAELRMLLAKLVAFSHGEEATPAFPTHVEDPLKAGPREQEARKEDAHAGQVGAPEPPPAASPAPAPAKAQAHACPVCNGEGHAPGEPPEQPCGACGGSGYEDEGLPDERGGQHPPGWQDVKNAVEKPAAPPSDPEWFMRVIVPIPRKGMKRDEYLKAPDTIGSLFEARHGNDDEAQAARQRLFGFLNSYEPKGWVKRDGTQMPPSAEDLKFREALDAFGEWFEREHPDEKL